MDRQACRDKIKRHGLPLPPKSACFFCPAMKKQEITRLAVVDPDYYALALEMERLYRDGHHFRGDNYWTVRAQFAKWDKETQGPIPDKIVEVYEAESAAEVRALFRKAYGDTKSPFKYKLNCSAAVPGLGRGYAWKDVPLDLVQLR